jgi:hypothetical protein
VNIRQLRPANRNSSRPIWVVLENGRVAKRRVDGDRSDWITHLDMSPLALVAPMAGLPRVWHDSDTTVSVLIGLAKHRQQAAYASPLLRPFTLNTT